MTQNDCDFLLLCKTPEGKIYQVLVEQEIIKSAIETLFGKFRLLDAPIEGIDFEIPKETIEGNGK